MRIPRYLTLEFGYILLPRSLRKGEIKRFGPRLKQNKLCFARIQGNFVSIEPTG